MIGKTDNHRIRIIVNNLRLQQIFSQAFGSHPLLIEKFFIVLQCTMHNAQCTMHNAQCTMHNAQ